jgi:hypothetical protein
MVSALQIESERGSGVSRLPVLLSTAGLALLGYGTWMHLSVAGQVRCDGCTPWHPLFVLAPLAVGGTLSIAASALLAFR